MWLCALGKGSGASASMTNACNPPTATAPTCTYGTYGGTPTRAQDNSLRYTRATRGVFVCMGSHRVHAKCNLSCMQPADCDHYSRKHMRLVSLAKFSRFHMQVHTWLERNVIAVAVVTVCRSHDQCTLKGSTDGASTQVMSAFAFTKLLRFCTVFQGVGDVADGNGP